MGEAKQRADAQRRKLEELTSGLADQGKIIEAGFAAYAITSMHPRASAQLLGVCHHAYMAGAQHLYGSLMTFLDDGEEPTDQDLERLTLIANELNAWAVRIMPTKGNA